MYSPHIHMRDLPINKTEFPCTAPKARTGLFTPQEYTYWQWKIIV